MRSRIAKVAHDNAIVLFVLVLKANVALDVLVNLVRVYDNFLVRVAWVNLIVSYLVHLHNVLTEPAHSGGGRHLGLYYAILTEDLQIVYRFVPRARSGRVFLCLQDATVIFVLSLRSPSPRLLRIFIVQAELSDLHDKVICI